MLGLNHIVNSKHLRTTNDIVELPYITRPLMLQELLNRSFVNLHSDARKLLGGCKTDRQLPDVFGALS